MIAIVVGIGPGLGIALARRFGEGGATIIALGRNLESTDKLSEVLRNEGITAYSYAADIGDETDLRRACGLIKAEHGDPDIVLFNASINPPGTPGEVSIDDVVTAFKVGAVGALVSLQEFMPAMRERGNGTFFTTGGGLGLHAWAPATALGMSKAALRNFTDAAARDLDGSGVHVATLIINGVFGAPGLEPAAIAAKFWELQQQQPGAWDTEIIFTG